MKQPIQVLDRWSSSATDLRNHFEKVFENPHQPGSERFVWDYWNIPDQYALLRTPAYHFFPKKIYEKFHRSLVMWGRENLGCHDISPPWLSCYVDGCFQNMHCDAPHGPWAFVYSLTPWKDRPFTGGETFLLQPSLLRFWEQPNAAFGAEQGQILEHIESKFNRLLVFDPRIPHGVKQVRGVHDVRQARLVIHGWFVNPRPFVAGPLPLKAVEKMAAALEREVLNGFFQKGVWQGTLIYRFEVSARGEVATCKLLSTTLQSKELGDVAELQKRIQKFINQFEFPKSKSISTVTFPLSFEMT